MEMVEKIKQFLEEARGELKRVTWSTRQQATTTTKVVIVMVIIMSVYLGLVDVGLSSLVRYFLH